MRRISYSSGWHRTKKGYPRNQFGSKFRKKFRKSAQGVFKKRYRAGSGYLKRLKRR